jgi:hypothetical protein
MELLGFIPEHQVQPSPAGAVRKYVRDVITDATDHHQKITHAPDDVFALAYNGRPALFFLEIDRGTEVLSNPENGFLKMVRFYLTYLRDGGYQRYREGFGVGEPFKGFRALVVTTSSERVQHIGQAAGRLPFDPPQAKHFVWLTSTVAIFDPTFFMTPCVSSDPGDAREYSILPRA